MQLRFYFDVVCPFAWVASQQVEALAAEAGAELIWHPVLLGAVLKAVGSPTVPMDAMAPAKWRIVRNDAVRQGAWRGTPVHWPSAHPQRTVDAMRLLCATPPALRGAVATDLFRAYWVDGVPLGDAIPRAAVRHGLAPDAFASDDARRALYANTAAAVDAGVFGVPAFGVDGSLVAWGVDRLDAVREALGLSPEPARDHGGRGGKLSFFHDFASPFSYLASTAVEALAADTGAVLEPVPFLLGAVFKHLGGPIVPIATFAAAKRRWLEKDLVRLARNRGVPLRWPTAFPLRTVLPLRVAVQQPAAMAPLYRAAWVDDRDIGRPEVVAGVLDAAGLDGQALVDGAADPAVKTALRLNTERAIAAGACGAPTFVVDDTHLFWGQDRMDQVRATLTGWTPPVAPAA